MNNRNLSGKRGEALVRRLLEEMGYTYVEKRLKLSNNSWNGGARISDGQLPGIWIETITLGGVHDGNNPCACGVEPCKCKDAPKYTGGSVDRKKTSFGSEIIEGTYESKGIKIFLLVLSIPYSINHPSQNKATKRELEDAKHYANKVNALAERQGHKVRMVVCSSLELKDVIHQLTK